MPRAKNTEEKSAAEQLLDVQDIVIGENTTGYVHDELNDTEEPKNDSESVSEKVQDSPSNFVVLTGCASVFTHGIHFEKGVPVQIEDQGLFDYLKQSGLFV